MFGSHKEWDGYGAVQGLMIVPVKNKSNFYSKKVPDWLHECLYSSHAYLYFNNCLLVAINLNISQFTFCVGYLNKPHSTLYIP